MLYKYLTDSESLHYLSVLPDLVKTYNNRGHRSLKGLTPNQAFKVKNRRYVRGIHIERYASIKPQKPKLSIGDVVRVKSQSSKVSSAARAYVQQYMPEYFKVIRIHRKLPIPMYEIQSLDNNEIIQGSFYYNELSKVIPETFKIQKVIRWKGKKPHRQALVSWVGFSDKHNSWVRERDIVQTYQ